jgi:hypothetical protein
MDGHRLKGGLTRRALRLATMEGLCYAVMVGLGETWFIPYAIERGASAGEAGMMLGVALGAGGVGSVVALRALAWARCRKPLVLAGCATQALVLLCLPRVASVTSVLALIAVYHVAAQLAGTSWAAWYGDVVPPRIRGRYFGRRTRAIHLVTFVSLLVGGLVLHRLSGAPLEGSDAVSGFSVVFALAAAARLGSTLLLSFSPEPRFAGLPDLREVAGFLRSQRGAPVARLLLIAAAFQLSVYLASPFFTPYMITELGLGYLELTAATGAVVLLKVTTLPRWGHAIDRLGARPVFLAAALMVATIPLPWLWATGLGWALVAQALSGLSWAGYEVGVFSLLLHGARGRVRAPILAAHNLLVGLCQLAGALLGRLIVVDGGAGCRRAFAVSAIFRLALAVAAFRLLKGLAAEAGSSPTEVLLRVVGLRPQGGIAHRPVIGVGEDPDDGTVAVDG